MTDSALSHCAQVVRDFDRERFTTALFAPQVDRDGLMTLYAFNAEVARIRESVKEPMAGLIRLQWWRDWLAAALEGRDADRHPVAAPLGRLIRERGLPAAEFERLLDARERDMDGAGPPDRAAAEAYAEASSGSLARLAALILGAGDEASLAAAGHVGTAWALVGQARAVGFHLSIGRLTLPADALAEAGGAPEQVLAGQAPPGVLAAGAKALGEIAQARLGEVKKLKYQSLALPALLPAVLAACHLRVLARAGWNPMSTSVAGPAHHPLRLAWAAWHGRI